MIYSVPEQWGGKTLKQIGEEIQARGGSLPRIDTIAYFAGVNENTPLTAGQAINLPANYANSSEEQFLKNNFITGLPPAKTAEDYATEYTKAIQDSVDKETKWVGQYLKDNPFVFDEELARKSSTAQYQPYYTELLQDYLTDINYKRQTTQDEQKLLTTLRDLDVGARSRSYQYAVENANEGWAGKGLFGSGMRVRDIGKQNIEYKAGSEAATARYETGAAGLNRNLEQYQTDEQRQRRDTERSQQVAIEGGILQRKEEAIKPYQSNLEQTYKRQFHPEQMTAVDYLPPSYLRY